MKKHEMAEKMKMPEEHDYYGKCKACGRTHHVEKGQHGMIEGKSKKSQKGGMSRNSVGRNEGEKHYLGRNEEPVA